MLFEEKSNLARLMATENLFVEERNVQTAYFDLEKRVLTIPILDGNLSSNLYDLLIGHEVSHALETPRQGWHDSIIDHGVNKSILNVCEDARIEKKIKRRFPGIRASFIGGYKELVDRDFFGIKGQNLQKLNFIDRINLYTKVGTQLDIEFSDEEKILVREVENTESFEDVVIVATKIQKFMKEQHQKKPVESTTAPTFQNDEDNFELDSSDDADISDSDEYVEEKKEETNSEKKEASSSSESKEQSNDVVNEQDDVIEYDVKDTEESSNESEEKIIESKTDKSFRQKEKELYSKTATQVRYLNVPKIEIDEFVIDYKEILKMLDSYLCEDATKDYYERSREIAKQEFLKYKKSADNTVSYLVKEFELRKNAAQQARVKISKSGDINPSRVYEYSFNDDIFKKVAKIPNGKSHGLVLYLDWSGSMQPYIHQTIKQVINIVLFCKKCNIPFEVYAFTSNKIKRTETFKKTFYKTGDIMIMGFNLMNLFSSKMNNNDFSKACSYFYNYMNPDIPYYDKINFPQCMNLSSTPLNEAIISAFEINTQFKRDNKLDIVNAIFLTDGEGHTLSLYKSGKEYTSFRSSSYDKVYIRDLVTKTTFEMKNGVNFNSGRLQTNILMRLLKKRLNCKIVGFMIVGRHDFGYRINELDENLKNKSRFENDKEIEKMKTEFKKNKYFIVTNSYADEYYMIRSNVLDTDDEEFNIESTNIKTISSAFSKYNGNKIQSRVLLNRFINLIA